MIKKILCVTLCAMLYALCLPVSAQQPGKIPTIGFMRGGSPTDPEVEAFRQGLRELGYVEGKNIIIEVRNTDGRTDHFSGGEADRPDDSAERAGAGGQSDPMTEIRGQRSEIIKATALGAMV